MYVGSELLADAAIDDEVDRGVERQEEVVEVHQHVERHGDVVTPHLFAVQEVVVGVLLRVGQLVYPQRESVGVAEDEDEHDGDEDDG